MKGKSNENLFCWEQVLKTNRLFRVTHAFADDSSTDGLLPLYALFSSIEQVCSEVADEDVARRKLDWWREECLLKDMASSNHPVIRKLCSSGAASKIQKRNIAQLLDGAESRLDASPPADIEALQIICESISRPQLELEISVCSGVDKSADLFSADSSQSGLLQLIRESVAQEGQAGYWWIPLNLLARHGLTRADVVDTAATESAKGLFSEILGAGQKWGTVSVSMHKESSTGLKRMRHLAVIHGLYRKKLEHLDGQKPQQFAQELNRLRLMDLFEAWKVARWINRP